MAGHNKWLKRKGGVDQISDDFSDFSLSSPPTKIRRLDGVLPPIVEEDEPAITVPIPPAPAPSNDERALVLFKPIVHHSPSSFSLSFDSNLISQIKNSSNQLLPWLKQSDSCDYERLIGSYEQEEQNDDDDDNRRLAIVPWVPQQPSPPSHSDNSSSNNNNTELMEADEMGEGEVEGVAPMMMDVEQQDTDTACNSSTSTFHHPTMLNLHQGVPAGIAATVPEGFQQHCLLPQLPQNTSTPITWTR